MMFEAAVFDFTLEEIRSAAAANRLLALELEFNRACNYRCPYCYAGEGGAGQASGEELTSEELDDVIVQAAELGARKIVVLGGEPLLYPRLREKIEIINGHGMGAEIFTNGSLIDAATAQWLAGLNTRVVVKLNSLDAEVQQRLTGVPDALKLAMRALDELQQAGFSGARLAASSVICRENAAEAADLWSFLRERQITPYLEIMTPQGRLKDNPELEVGREELREIFHEISHRDAALGYHWEPRPPLVGGTCLRHHYSCLVNAVGEVMPCVGVTIAIGNVRDCRLRDILAESTVIKNLKNYRRFIKEPCRSCELAGECYGCRGAAYQLTGDYLAADPLCWRNSGQELVSLPVEAAPLLPHGRPMAMIDRLLSCGEESVLEATIGSENRFLDGNGIFDRSAVPELAAQAAAAANTFREGKMTPGMLVGVNFLEFHDDIRVGDRLLIAVRELAELDNFHIAGFSIRRENGDEIAYGELKVCLLTE